MKNLGLSFIVLFVLVGLSSCTGSRSSIGGSSLPFNPDVPSCERFQTGEICFVNRTLRRVSLEVGEQIIHIAAMGKICLDMEAKSKPYRYKAEQVEGRRKTKWRTTDFRIEMCETREIDLYANN